MRLYNYVPDYVVFDLETTGISPHHDEVIEISAVKVKGGAVVDEFSTLVDPGRPIPCGASMVNGITDDMVAGCPAFIDVLGDFLDFTEGLPLVGHNIHKFDMQFLWRDAERFWGRSVDNDYIDTLTMSRQYVPGLQHYRLVDMACHYGISDAGAHRALNDCRMNQQVFEKLGGEIRSAAANGISICPRCGQPLKKRNGKFGAFMGCTGYPRCRYTRDL